MKNLFKLSLVSLLVAGAAWADEGKIEPPVPVRTTAPVYPHDMRQRGISGLVTIKCRVDEQGNVQDTTVEKSSDSAFEKPALSAVQRWKFKPATQNGSPVAMLVSIPIRFINGD